MAYINKIPVGYSQKTNNRFKNNNDENKLMLMFKSNGSFLIDY